MVAYVVDENVPIVANDASRPEKKSPQADAECRQSCIRVLKLIVAKGAVVLDDAGEVMFKYRRRLSGTGQPGVGDAFLKHLSDRQYDRRKVLRISLHQSSTGEFTDFPDDPALASFDPADRIFVALARAAPSRSAILNAVDSDYQQHRRALGHAGVHVTELCPHCIRTAAR